MMMSGLYMKDIITKTLDVALRESLPVRIVYDGKDGITERVIVINSIQDERIVAYCRLRRRISTFKLGKVLAAQVVYGK